MAINLEMSGARVITRLLSTSARRLNAESGITTPVAVPVKPVRRVGALRGGFTGFLVGVTVTGAAAYYYLLDEYQAGQRAILSDVFTLRESLVDLSAQIALLKKEAETGK